MVDGAQRNRVDDHSALVARIYEAAIRPADWASALAVVGDSVGASSAFMFSTHSKTDPDAVLLVHNHRPEMPAEYAKHWHSEDLWAAAAGPRGFMRRNSIVLGTELVPRDVLLRSAFYNDFNRYHGVDSLLGCVLFDDSEHDGMPLTNLSFHREAGKPDFDAESKRQMARLMPHFQQAMRLQRQARALDAPYSPATTALAALEIACIMLDAKGGVVQCNDAGTRLLGGGGMARYRAGRLTAIGSHCAPPLPEAMARCRNGAPVRMLARLQGPQAAVLSATLLKLPSATPTRVGAFDADRWLLLVETPRGDLSEVAERVAELFGLSRAEVRVLARLLEGCAAADIASRTNTSLATVRTHIRSIFAKTNVTRQIDLVRLLCGLRA